MHPTIFGDNSKSFTTSENAPYVHFLRDGDKRSAARDGDNDVSGISNDCKSFTTSESTQTVYFPRDGDKRSAARDERMRRTGVAGDRGKPE